MLHRRDSPVSRDDFPREIGGPAGLHTRAVTLGTSGYLSTREVVPFRVVPDLSTSLRRVSTLVDGSQSSLSGISRPAVRGPGEQTATSLFRIAY